MVSRGATLQAHRLQVKLRMMRSKHGSVVAMLAAGLHAASAVGTLGWVCRMDPAGHAGMKRCCPEKGTPGPLALERDACCDRVGAGGAQAPAEAASTRAMQAKASASAALAPAPAPSPVLTASLLPVAASPPRAAPPLYLAVSSLLI
jgi:hypothetical protein